MFTTGPALDTAQDLWIDVERNAHPESEYLFVPAHSEKLQPETIVMRYLNLIEDDVKKAYKKF